MGFASIGILIGVVFAIGSFLAAILPYAVLASALSKEEKKD